MKCFEELLMFTEQDSKDELQEIEELKAESLNGESVRWDEFKKR